jgi:hypothetical protein
MQETAGFLFEIVVVSKKNGRCSTIQMKLLLEATAVAAGIDYVVSGNRYCCCWKKMLLNAIEYYYAGHNCLGHS